MIELEQEELNSSIGIESTDFIFIIMCFFF